MHHGSFSCDGSYGRWIRVFVFLRHKPVAVPERQVYVQGLRRKRNLIGAFQKLTVPGICMEWALASCEEERNCSKIFPPTLRPQNKNQPHHTLWSAVLVTWVNSAESSMWKQTRAVNIIKGKLYCLLQGEKDIWQKEMGSAWGSRGWGDFNFK